jgi:hypothetical protein
MPIDKSKPTKTQPKSDIKMPKQPRIKNTQIQKMPRRSLLGSV